MQLNLRSENRFYNFGGRMVRSQSAANFNIGGAAGLQLIAERLPGGKCVGFGSINLLSSKAANVP